jgi:hypothetical protein
MGGGIARIKLARERGPPPGGDAMRHDERNATQIWRRRRASLRERLGAEPRGEWSWLWRCRLHVLDFLLRRYGGPPAADEHEPAPPDAPPEPPHPYVTPRVSLQEERAVWHERARRRAHRILTHIAVTLEEVPPTPEMAGRPSCAECVAIGVFLVAPVVGLGLLAALLLTVLPCAGIGLLGGPPQHLPEVVLGVGIATLVITAGLGVTVLLVARNDPGR